MNIPMLKRNRISQALLLAVFFVMAGSMMINAAPVESDKFAAAANDFYQKKLFTGTVLVSEGDNIIYRGSFGKANIELGVANGPDMKFLIGSNSKCYVATVIWQMVAEGTLSEDGTISQYLPYYTSPIGKKVTIRDLVEMSSGIADYQTGPGTEQYYQVRLHPWSVQEFVTKFCMPSELLFEPGTKYQYADSNYYILGAIIEKLTGSFKQTLQEKILDPAGLTNTGTYEFFPENPQEGMYQLLPVIPGLVSGYVYPESLMRGYRDIAYGPEIQQAGSVFTSGNMYSNLADFQKWCQVLYTDKLLPEKYKELMFEPIRLADLVGLKCLYGTPGWNIQYLDPKTYKPSCNCPENPAELPKDYIPGYFFAGRYPGYISSFMRFPTVPSLGPGITEKKQVAIVVLSNHDNVYGAMALAIVLRDVLFNVPSPTVNNVADLQKVLQDCSN